MGEKYMKHIDECGMYYYICNGKEIIAESFYGDDAQDIVDLLNEQDKRIKELEKEVLDLRAEVGRLNSKKEVEIPHWLKYESSKGYTKKVNQDIRFDDKMTEIQYCRDCKYLSTDGMFGLICDVCEDNRNYDCPKYEEKRYIND